MATPTVTRFPETGLSEVDFREGNLVKLLERALSRLRVLEEEMLSIQAASNEYLSRTVTAEKTGGDLIFLVDSTGIVLVDRTLGSRWRVYVDGGALLVEVIT